MEPGKPISAPLKPGPQTNFPLLCGFCQAFCHSNETNNDHIAKLERYSSGGKKDKASNRPVDGIDQASVDLAA